MLVSPARLKDIRHTPDLGSLERALLTQETKTRD